MPELVFVDGNNPHKNPDRTLLDGEEFGPGGLRAVSEIVFTSIATPDALSGSTIYASATSVIAFTSSASPTRMGEAVCEIVFTSSANPSVDGSPDTFESATSEIVFTTIATPTVTINASATSIIYFESEVGEGHIIAPDEFLLTFIFDTPDVLYDLEFGAEENYVYDLPRILTGPVDTDPADWQEIPFGKWAYNETENSAGASVTFQLVRMEDADNFGPDSRIEFGLGRKDTITDLWDESTFTILIPNGQFRASRHVVGWDGGSPTDAIEITVASDLDERLIKTAENDLIIYDPSKETVDSNTIEPIRDTLGNFYVTEVLPFPGLSLHSLFQTILVERCGFANYATNIPDYGVTRYDCEMGSGLYGALSGFIGMFDPVIYSEGSVIWIIDTSLAAPEGFPDAREYSPTYYKQLDTGQEREKIDGIVVQYIEEEAAFDFFTHRTDDPEVTQTESEGLTRVTTERRFIEYRKFILPYIVQSSALDKETRTTVKNHVIIQIRQETLENGNTQITTFYNDNITIESAVDDLTYHRGRVSTRIKTVSSFLPNQAMSSATNTFFQCSRPQLKQRYTDIERILFDRARYT